MNTKRIVILFLVLGIAATAAFASGKDEQPGAPPRAGSPELSEETVTVTGELYFENRIHPELLSKGMEYELLVPRYYAYELELEEGQTITVEGNLVESMPCCLDEEGDEIHLWVTKAIIDGEEYELDRGRRMGPGPRWGMHPRRGGRRPGYGHPEDDRGWGRRM